MARIIKADKGSVRRITLYERDTLADPLAGLPDLGGADPHDPEAVRLALLAQAKDEAAAKVQEAYTEGLRRGEEAGRTAFETSVAESAACLRAAGEAMQRARESFLETLEPQLVDLVKLVAAKVIDRELRTDDALIHNTIRRALAVIADRERLRVRVHPSDLEALRQQRVTLLEEFEGVHELEIECDPDITPGGCVVDSEFVHVDARLESLLANVLDALTE